MEKESFINAILNSTNGMKTLYPNPELFSKIEQRIQERMPVSSTTLWLVAASIVVLIFINVGIINSRQTPEEVTTLTSTISKSNQLY